MSILTDEQIGEHQGQAKEADDVYFANHRPTRVLLRKPYPNELNFERHTPRCPITRLAVSVCPDDRVLVLRAPQSTNHIRISSHTLAPDDVAAILATRVLSKLLFQPTDRAFFALFMPYILRLNRVWAAVIVDEPDE